MTRPIDTPYTLYPGETAIKKADLVVGGYYLGRCRNARVARWDGKIFRHWHKQFGGKSIDTINHPEDDNGYDCFTPIMVETDRTSVEEIPLSLPPGTKINPGWVQYKDIAKEGEDETETSTR